MSSLHRHIEACNDARSTAQLVPWSIGSARVGWLTAEIAQRLRSFRDAFRPVDDGLELVAGAGVEARTEALARIAAHLATAGVVKLRGEAFDVRAEPDSEVLARLDRGALSPLGVVSHGVHVNGRVRRPDGLHLWVGWRSKDKGVAPGQLDNLIAGGVPSGLSPMQTLLKEAAEEASMPAGTRRASAAGLAHLLPDVRRPRHPPGRAALLRPRRAGGLHAGPRRRRGGALRALAGRARAAERCARPRT